MPVRTKPAGERGAHFIKAWRKAKGLTQAQVADLVGTSTANISRIESGDQAYTQDMLEGIARALEVSPASLIASGPDGGDPASGEPISATVAEIPEEAGSPASGNRIAEARKQRGLTQTQLAEALGTGRSQIVKLERGERRLTVDWARRIATALGVEVSALIDGEMPSEVPMPSSHTILIRRAAIQAAERIVAMAGPINAAPRDVVRQIVTEAFGFWMESDGDPR
jgi:transcriptional regulator with XRE-family HTH domain